MSMQFNTSTDSKQLSFGTDLNIVLLHGWGMNQGIWTGFADRLANTLQVSVTCLDLPGFGNAHEVLLAPYNIQTMAQYIYKQLPDNCILVGWSLGGLVAQYIVSKIDAKNNVLKTDASESHTSKVKAHIQICSSPKFAASDNWPAIKPDVLHMFNSQLQSNHKALLKRFLAIQSMGLDNAKVRVKEMMEKLQAFPLSSAQALGNALEVLSETDLRQSIKEDISLPCLYIFGRLDSLVPCSAIEHIKELNPNAHIEIITKASHAPFLSHPDETLSLMTTFIKKLDSLD